jgi:hypothetical protein
VVFLSDSISCSKILWCSSFVMGLNNHIIYFSLLGTHWYQTNIKFFLLDLFTLSFHSHALRCKIFFMQIVVQKYIVSFVLWRFPLPFLKLVGTNKMESFGRIFNDNNLMERRPRSFEIHVECWGVKPWKMLSNHIFSCYNP